MPTRSGTRMQLNYQHFQESFRWSTARQISWMVKIWGYARITQTLIVYCKTAGVPGMGPGKRVTVAWVASRYSVLRLPEDLGLQTGSGFLIGLPGMGLQPLLYCQYMMYMVYAIYRKFGMTSHPRQQLLAVSLQRLLYQPVLAIPRLLEGRNQGPLGLDYRYTGYTGA